MRVLFCSKFFRLSLLSLGLVALIAWPSSTAWADNVEDLEMWLPVTLEVKVAPRIKLQGEVQTRLGNNISDLDRLVIRGGVGVEATKNLSFWTGYIWVPIFQALSVANGEFTNASTNVNILYQHALLENQWGKLKITNRARLEELFIENTSGTLVRTRYMLRLAYPLTKSGKLSAVASSELFINLNDLRVGPQAGFAQNRTFAGLNYKLMEHVSLEGGYMWNPVNVFNSATNRLNHNIVLGVNFRY